MKLSTLLSQRPALLRQLRLANVAFAYHTLSSFCVRAARAQLHGAVTLKNPLPDEGLYCATLTPLQGSQAVVEEHFTDEDLMDLADVVAFTQGRPANDGAELTFAIEDIPEVFLAPLRAELEQSGVAIDAIAQPLGEQSR